MSINTQYTEEFSGKNTFFSRDSEFFEKDIPSSQNNENLLDNTDLSQSDLLHMLRSPQGRRFIRRIFRMCGVFNHMPVGDSAIYAWHEGRRSIGLSLYHQVFGLGQNFINQLLQEDHNNV